LLADDGVGTPITLSTTAEGNLATAL
jgi:hypothetical protein